MAISRHARLVPRANVTYRSLGDGALLVDLDTGVCWELNRVAAELWQRLSAGDTVGAASDLIRSHYDVSAEVIDADVARWCDRLVAAGLLQAIPGESPAP
jgi:hypothetical protein